MHISFEVDPRAFEKALVQYMEHTKRSLPEVVNRAAVNVIITAAQRTLTSDSAAIKRELSELTPSKSGKSMKSYPKPIVYKIVNAKRKKDGKGPLIGSSMSSEARKLIAQRMSSTKYVAYAGWQKALIEVGGRGFGQKVDGKSGAAQGFGHKATISRAVAVMCNRALDKYEHGSSAQEGAFRVISESAAAAFHSALQEKAEDMRQEAIRRAKSGR